jgi:hypothetical protein
VSILTKIDSVMSFQEIFNPFRVVFSGDYIVSTNVERLQRSKPNIGKEHISYPEGIYIGSQRIIVSLSTRKGLNKI